MSSNIRSSARSAPRRNIIRSVPQHILEWCIEDLQKVQQNLVAILDTNPSPDVADKALDSLKLVKGQLEELGRRAES